MSLLSVKLGYLKIKKYPTIPNIANITIFVNGGAFGFSNSLIKGFAKTWINNTINAEKKSINAQIIGYMIYRE